MYIGELESGFLLREPGSVLIVSVISAKVHVNRPSFQKAFCLENEMDQQGPLCLRVLLGVSLTSQDRFLVGPTCTRTGIRPAFLSPGGAPSAGKSGKLSFFNKKREKKFVFPLQFPVFACLI